MILIRNTTYLEVTKNSSEPLIFSKDKAIGVHDLGSIGYYKVKQNTIWHHLQHYHEFKPLQVLYEEFNKLTNILKREEPQPTDIYTWLAEDDERRNLTDRDILEKYIDLEILGLPRKKRKG